MEGKSSWRLVFALFMIVFYLGVGLLFIIFSDLFTINPVVCIGMGVIFILYGAYRGIRFWRGF